MSKNENNSRKIKLISYVDNDEFKKPFVYGWKRELVYENNASKSKNGNVFYITPTGKKLRNKKEIQSVLEDSLHINMFTFSKKPLGCNGEIIRTALPKGFQKNLNKPSGVEYENVNKLNYASNCNVDMEVDLPEELNKSVNLCVMGERDLMKNDDLLQIHPNSQKYLCKLSSNDAENVVVKVELPQNMNDRVQETVLRNKCGPFNGSDLVRVKKKSPFQLKRPNIKNLTIMPNNSENVGFADVTELQEMLNEKDDVINHLKICLNRAESEIANLQNRNPSNSSKTATLEQIGKCLPMLSSNQIALMSGAKKRINWTSDEIANGFAMSYFNRRGYNFLIHKLKIALPSLRTLHEWGESMTIAPGLLKDSLLVLKAFRDSLTEVESQVIISYDEMKCKSLYQYNKTLDSIMGPNRQMQTVMIRGLFAKYKQPIHIDFDRNVTPDLLNLLFTELHNIGYNVVGSVSDNGGGNVGLWGNCDVNFRSSGVKHPVTGDLIFMFSDVPHLLKLLRNWFIDGGFLLKDGTELNQAKIRELLKTNTEISPIYILSIKHLELEKNERQNVRMACELFSHRVAQSLRRNFPFDEEAEKLASFIELVNNWFDIMNSYSPNGIGFKQPYGVNLEEQNKILDEMYSTVKDMKCFNKKKELLNSLQIFQKGILMSITSIKALRCKMEEKFGYTYILTHRTNQDCLENFYSQMRGRNGQSDHPTPVECLNNIKTIILGKNPGLSSRMHSNTIERDPDDYVSATFNVFFSEHKSVENELAHCKASSSATPQELQNQNDERVDEEIDGEEYLDDKNDDVPEEFLEANSDHVPEEFLDVEYLSDEFLDTSLDNEQIEFLEEEYFTKEFLNDLSNEMDIDVYGTRIAKSTEDGLEYIAGWIAWRFKNEKPNYSKSRRESLPSHITDHTYAKCIGLSSTSWIDSISYGGLTKPTEQMLKWVNDMENQFLKIHGSEFNYRMHIQQGLIETLQVECDDVPKEVVKLFAKSRIYMRCKYLNKKRLEEALIAKKLKKQERATKRGADILEDLSRTRAKKLKKIFS